MLLLIDNFDSFTYNLVHVFQVLGFEVLVMRNNARSVEECMALQPEAVVIGPGPGTPADAGISIALMKACAGKIPLLGVCLGHQCLSVMYGGHIVRGKKPVHGKVSKIFHHDNGMFRGVKQGFEATRYHSLVVDRDRLPSCLEVTAETKEGEIMGLKHLDYPIESIQFHPESIQTEDGSHLLKNFLLGELVCSKN